MQALIPWHNASDPLNQKAATYPESQAENKLLCRTGGITIKTFNDDIKPFTDFLVWASQPSAKRDETVQALAGSHEFWKHDFSIAEDSKTHEPLLIITRDPGLYLPVKIHAMNKKRWQR